MYTHGVGMGTVHPIIEEGFLRFARRVGLVTAPQHVHRSSRIELVPEVAAHFDLLRLLVAHDEHLTTMPVRSMGVDEYTHNRL